MKKYIFFDLDGTLTDSAEGITNSVAYVLKHYGISVKDKSTLNVFVGPPLVESFMKYYGFDREQARASVEIYREYFEDKGMFENAVYPGIPELFRRLEKRWIQALRGNLQARAVFRKDHRAFRPGGIFRDGGWRGHE